MRCIRTFCAKINKWEAVLLSEGFDGKWTFLIWGSHPVQGYIGKTSEADAKDKVLKAIKASWAASGRNRGSAALSDLPWQVAIRHIVSTRTAPCRQQNSNSYKPIARLRGRSKPA